MGWLASLPEIIKLVNRILDIAENISKEIKKRHISAGYKKTKNEPEKVLKEMFGND